MAMHAVNIARRNGTDHERVLGPDHPATLTTRGNIAYWTGGPAGDPVEALRLLRSLLPDHERVLGPDHPDTLATRYGIAYLRQQIGEES